MNEIEKAIAELQNRAGRTLKTALSAETAGLAVEALEELKRYSDLQEQGRLVVLPCKRGDVIYFIKSTFSWAAFPIAAKVVSIRGINCDNEVMYRAITINNKLDKCFTSKNIGKTVFLSEAEAQAVLDRLESK